MCTVYVRTDVHSVCQDRCAQCMSGTDVHSVCQDRSVCTVYVRDRCAQCMSGQIGLHSVCEGQMCTVYVRTDVHSACQDRSVCTVYVKDRCAQCMSVSSPPAVVKGLSQYSKANINVISTQLNSAAELSLCLLWLVIKAW